MATGNNLAGAGENLDNSLNTIISEFFLLREEGVTVKKLATHYNLKPHTGTSYEVRTYGSLSAYALTDGVDMAQAQALSDATSSYTPSEVGVQVIVANTTLRRTADPELYKNIGRMMRSAYNRKEDSDGVTQFDSFTTSIGGAATVLGIGHILSARSSLRVGNSNATPEPAPEPIYAVFHPGQLHTILGRLIPLGQNAGGGTAYGVADGAHNGKVPGAGRTDMSDQILRRGKDAVGSLFGVPIYEDANITVDGNNDAKGAMFSKAGLIQVVEFEPSEAVDEDKSLRAKEVNIVGSYTWGLYRPAAFGVEIFADASLPTS